MLVPLRGYTETQWCFELNAKSSAVYKVKLSISKIFWSEKSSVRLKTRNSYFWPWSPFVSSCQVVSGSDWGNLLLWDSNAIKVEICRKEGRNCHTGMAQPFALEDGQLMTFGSDGAVRVRCLASGSSLKRLCTGIRSFILGFGSVNRPFLAPNQAGLMIPMEIFCNEF